MWQIAAFPVLEHDGGLLDQSLLDVVAELVVASEDCREAVRDAHTTMKPADEDSRCREISC